MTDPKMIARFLRDASPGAIVGLGYIEKAADAIEQLVKERDAAVADLKNIRACKFCKNLSQHIDKEPCNSCLLYVRGRDTNNFEWRGVQEDNNGLS